VFNKPEPDPGLESVISYVESEMKSYDADSKEFKEAAARYQQLKALQADMKPKRLSADAMLTAATSILGIVIIVGYEQKNVITSKAIGFVKKLT
jgi:hypothetical protein